MPSSVRSVLRLLLAGLLLAAAMTGERGDAASSRSDAPAIRALAPAAIIASGFEQLSGVAVDPAGAVLVTDGARGTLTRIEPTGAHAVLLENLQRPGSVAVDSGGSIFVVEAAGGRVLRLDPNGILSVVLDHLRQPRAVAVGPDDTVWLAMRTWPEQLPLEHGGVDAAPRSVYAVARVSATGTPVLVAEGLEGVDAMAVDRDAVYVTLARLWGERGRPRSAAGKIPIRPDGTAAPAIPLSLDELQRSSGVAVDRAGALFASGWIRDPAAGALGIILKRQATGEVVRFATGLQNLAAMAFAPEGDLVAVERRRPGRVVRFRAPPAPAPVVPAFTNENPLTVTGQAGARDRVEVFTTDDVRPVTAAIADLLNGRFSLQASIAPNRGTTLSFVPTGEAGSGLIGVAATAHVVHDDRPPIVTIESLLPGTHVRDIVQVHARGEDEGTGVASMALMIDDAEVAVVENARVPAPLSVAVPVVLSAVAEGPHTLTALARDRAGNTGAAAQLLVVDRTPPETRIVTAPMSHISAKEATYTVTGEDLQSPALEFSWRLDEGEWSPYSTAGTIVLRGLAAGRHSFHVKARDLAGNEDPTPAAHVFTVIALQMRVAEPLPGAVITTSTIWVRGMVEGQSGAATVEVPLSTVLGGTAAAPVEGGRFALEVPADPALTTLTALVTDQSGATARVDIPVVLAPDGSIQESLDVWPPGGTAPLDVRIGLHGLRGLPISLDVDGDGTREFEGELAVNDFYATYPAPGIYVPTVEIAGPGGDVRRRRAVVEVYDPAALDAQLQAVWSGFKNALRNGDVAAATGFIVAERRAAWAEYFASLPPGAFEDVDRVFPTMTPVEVGYGGAQYEIVTERDALIYSYAIWFQIDSDGRWRLWRF